MYTKNLEIKIPETDIIYKGPANHFVGIEGVGGKLYLTYSELIFKSHKFNVQKHVYRINLEEIVGIQPSSSPFKAFEFQDTDGNKEKFVVNGRKNWIEHILSQQNRL